MEEIISVGKILNFHGIAGIAKVGYSNIDIIRSEEHTSELQSQR